MGGYGVVVNNCWFYIVLLMLLLLLFCFNVFLIFLFLISYTKPVVKAVTQLHNYPQISCSTFHYSLIHWYHKMAISTTKLYTRTRAQRIKTKVYCFIIFFFRYEKTKPKICKFNWKPNEKHTENKTTKLKIGWGEKGKNNTETLSNKFCALNL